MSIFMLWFYQCRFEAKCLGIISLLSELDHSYNYSPLLAVIKER